MSSLPEKKWQELSVDIFGPVGNNDYLLVVMDDYSRFPVAEQISSTSSTSVIRALDKIINTFGIPNKIKTDNGSCFTSSEFREYANY